MGVNFRKLKTTIMKDLFSVDGKVIVITGATGILGSAMVKHFAEQGAKVVILARNEQMGGDLMAEVKAAGGEALYLKCDVTQKQMLEQNYADIMAAYGRIDVLINCAGGNMAAATVPPEKTIFDLDIDAVRQVVDLNLFGTILPTMVFVKAMVEQGQGSIINIASESALRPLTRVAQCKFMTTKQIYHLLADKMDIIYFSARKLGFARGGIITSHNKKYINDMMEFIPLYEGFLTYGGMEVRSMEALAVGLLESLDMEYINQGPEFIEYLVNELDKYGVPVVKPAGGLGAHLNCSEFVPHIPHEKYPAAAVATALYIASGIRGMERGSLSEQREPDGTERYAELELMRLAMPRRVFTLSQVKYCADRIKWLYDNRELIGGLQWVEEPKVLRFFFGRLKEIGYWQEDLAKKFREDFGESL